jgi:DNA invertase Pin-like site-specific DNA recombinase
MSDEAQQYSIDNQQEAIKEYADRRGFTIVKTYADSNRSGVIAKHRTALRDLLRDVVNGVAEYKAILVYDVSRWGRYPNNDEAAHYEFLCSSSGIPLHYCAEPFTNDGSASSSILKALKRSMAAEFSRELGEKEFRGKTRLVQLGFWVGGTPGYGYRRLMISASGKRKQLLKLGDNKSLTTDRVILVPGPRKEIECVRLMFSMAMERNGCSAIARHLNQMGLTHDHGRPWSHQSVFNILTNPKYAGCNVWHRSTLRLRDKRERVVREQWIMKPRAFVPIVDQDTFDRAQEALPRAGDYSWSDDEILRRVRRLLKVKGRLSENLLDAARGMPSLYTIYKHFGSYQRLYERVGYRIPSDVLFISEQAQRALSLRRELIETITTRFPNKVVISRISQRHRAALLIDGTFTVSILLCRPERRDRQNGKLCWAVEPHLGEQTNVTLLCTMNCTHDQVLDYYVFVGMGMCRSHRLYKNDPFLGAAVKIRDLSEFYVTVKGAWEQKTGIQSEIASRRA